MTGIAVVICIAAAGQRRARFWLDRENARVCLAGQFVLHKRCNQAAKVGTTARAADDDIRILVQNFHRGFAFQTDDGLVQHHLIEHRAEHIAAALGGKRALDRLGDRAAERSTRIRVLCKDLSANFGGHRRGGGHICIEYLHNCLAERFLLIRGFDLKNFQIQPEVGARLGKCSAPLTGAGFGGQRSQPLLLGVICLRDGRVEFVRTGSVVALEFVINSCRGIERLFEVVCANQRGRTINHVLLENRLGDVDITGFAVHLLMCKFFAENGVQRLFGDRLAGRRIQHRVGLFRHIGAHVVPLLGHLLFG